MHKIKSIHKLILKYSRMAMPIFDQAYPKITEITFSVPEFAPAHKKSVHSICSFLSTVNFRVLWPDRSHPVLIIPTQTFFDQLLVYATLYQHAKNQAISLVRSGNMVD